MQQTKAKAKAKAKPSLKGKLRRQVSVTREAHLESGTVANVLARKLQESISRGDFAVGSSLPSERDLMAQYRVSRATVREALRALRTHDLIEVKRGRSGGSFISIPGSHTVIRSLNQFIGGQNFRFIDLVAAREAIEPAAAAQAALSRTEEKLEALRLCSEECERNLEDIDSFVEANLKWHLALAEASDNPLFVAFLTSLASAMHSATAFEEFDIRTRMAVVGVHWQIYNAIRAKDPEAARRRTLRHLTAYGEELKSLSEEATLAKS
jgi:GntR family transcriptional repressor for pyruvate dehydrogenase complex